MTTFRKSILTKLKKCADGSTVVANVIKTTSDFIKSHNIAFCLHYIEAHREVIGLALRNLVLF